MPDLIRSIDRYHDIDNGGLEISIQPDIGYQTITIAVQRFESFMLTKFGVSSKEELDMLIEALQEARKEWIE